MRAVENFSPSNVAVGRSAAPLCCRSGVNDVPGAASRMAPKAWPELIDFHPIEAAAGKIKQVQEAEVDARGTPLSGADFFGPDVWLAISKLIR